MLHALRKFSLAGSLLLLGFRPPAFSQMTPPQSPELPHFEASSVKVVQWVRGGGLEHVDAGRIDYHIVALGTLVIRAFDVMPYLIQWPSSFRNGGVAFYDVQATFPASATVADRRLMLQSLLRERFGLRSHTEQRSLPVYALVVAPGGLKVRKAPPSDIPSTGQPGVGESPTAYTLNGDIPLSAVGDFSLYVDRPIVDDTGLEGDYAIHLTVPRGEAHFPGGPPPNPNELSAAQRAEMSGFDQAAFFSAVEKQLGLRFEKRNIPAEALVVDAINTVPTPN